MPDRTLTAIVLAAGKSTRMKSRLPKPLHEVCGRPMLSYILDACFNAGADRVLCVVGHGKDQVIDRFGNDPDYQGRIGFVEQTQMLGTGDAARVCVPELEKVGLANQDVIILAGDIPLVRAEALEQLVTAHREEQAAASMATAELDDPFGYGRVIRDENGEFVKIVEQLDATAEEAAVREVFPSYYCVKAEALVDALSRLKNDNAKGEYYLTDIFELARQAGGKVTAVQCVTAEDVIAPNTRQQLAEADAAMQARIMERLFTSGVSIVDPANTYIEHGVNIGADTKLLPFTFIGRGAEIGAECCVGPFAYVPRGGVVKDGETLAGNAATAEMRPVED